MTTPESESLDEAMRGMGDPADYDDWAEEAPDREQRLTELVTQLAEYLGLTVTAEPVAPVTPSAFIQLKCGRCGGQVFMYHLRLDPGVTNELYDTHLCTGINEGQRVGEPAVFPFTLAVRSGT